MILSFQGPHLTYHSLTIINRLPNNMHRTVTLIHHQQRREFILSAKTKLNAFKALVKRAFNLPNDIRALRQAETRWSL